MNLRVSIMGMGAIKAKLTKLASDLKNPQIPMMQSAIQVQEETFRNFEKGGRPEEWAPLSLLTLFIRANRADGPKRTKGPEARVSRIAAGCRRAAQEGGRGHGTIVVL